jgi:hypothetical protein
MCLFSNETAPATETCNPSNRHDALFEKAWRVSTSPSDARAVRAGFGIDEIQTDFRCRGLTVHHRADERALRHPL